MKRLRILSLSVLLMLPLLALAKLQVPNEVLGKAEAGLDFCAQVDPGSAAKYQEKKKAFVQGASEEELDAARASQEYKDSYQSASGELSKRPKNEVKNTCAAALAGKK